MVATIEKRKLNIVQDFLLLDSDEAISKIELVINDEKKRVFDSNFSKKMTYQQLNQLLDSAEKDFENGNFYEAEKIKSIIDTWN